RDDLKRLETLNKPVALKFMSDGGEEVDVKDYRGKLVLVYFFANWSPPSMLGLTLTRDLAQKYRVQPIGVSLDADKATLLANLEKYKIDWPVFFDGAGWESPFVRSLGINALPTLWLIDRRGNLRTLNARVRTET